MFSSGFVDFTIVVLRAEKLHIVGNTTAKEGPTGVTGNGAVMDMIVSDIPAHVTGNLSYEFRPFTF